jgi:hypothetical protein
VGRRGTFHRRLDKIIEILLWFSAIFKMEDAIVPTRNKIPDHITNQYFLDVIGKFPRCYARLFTVRKQRISPRLLRLFEEDRPIEELLNWKNTNLYLRRLKQLADSKLCHYFITKGVIGSYWVNTLDEIPNSRKLSDTDNAPELVEYDKEPLLDRIIIKNTDETSVLLRHIFGVVLDMCEDEIMARITCWGR